jgi:H+-transporting ATPase
VFSGQAIYYAVRERRRIWSSRPSTIVLISSLADLLIVPSMAFAGILMASLPLSVILSVFAGAVVFAFILDAVKASIFRVLEME